MPIVTAAASSIPFVASVIWLAVIAVVVQKPDSSDIYSCLGAALASVCALVEARDAVRTWKQTISLFIFSAVIGSIGPSILYGVAKSKGWTNGVESILTWHFWAGAGFFFGLNGWAIAHGLNRLVRRILASWAAGKRAIPGDSVADPPTRPVN